MKKDNSEKLSLKRRGEFVGTRKLNSKYDRGISVHFYYNVKSIMSFLCFLPTGINTEELNEFVKYS